MKTRNFNIENINSLNDFYQIAETNALSLERNYDIVAFFLKYKAKTNSDQEKQLLQWEIEVFLFSFLGGKVFSFSTSNGKEIGEIAEYPTLDAHQTNAFEYLKERALKCTSPFFKARYNHVLWESVSKKNRQFAIDAAESYIQTIYYCCSQEKDDFTHVIGKLFENLVSISASANIDFDQLKKLTSFLLFKTSQLTFGTKHRMIDTMLENVKIFKPIDFQGTLSIFEDQLQCTGKVADDFMLVNYYLPTGVKVAQKLKSDVRKWHNEIGLAHLRIAEGETEDERNWLKLDAYRAAIDAFRLSGNQSKKETVEQLYFELKPKVRLDEYRHDFDEDTIKKLQELQNELKEKALHLLKEEPYFVYAQISRGSFFPKYDQTLKVAQNKEANFLDFVTTLHFDNNKNVSKQSAEKDERLELMNVYGDRIHGTLLPFLHYVVVLGIKSGQLTVRNFISFLIEHSWIGKPYVRTDLGGNPEEINFIRQIMPSIAEFFNQVLAWGETKYYTPNFILCTDSLTLKIEGLFRNFSERLNISTSKGKKKGMQEALAHDVINNDTIKKYFNEDDRLLFDYVFSNEGGLNLRNNIAHCFYSENEYHPDKMLLLLAVLLRLGKYNIANNSDQQN